MNLTRLQISCIKLSNQSPNFTNGNILYFNTTKAYKTIQATAIQYNTSHNTIQATASSAKFCTQIADVQKVLDLALWLFSSPGLLAVLMGTTFWMDLVLDSFREHFQDDEQVSLFLN